MLTERYIFPKKIFNEFVLAISYMCNVHSGYHNPTFFNLLPTLMTPVPTSSFLIHHSPFPSF